jgi:hypothetical protein
MQLSIQSGVLPSAYDLQEMSGVGNPIFEADPRADAEIGTLRKSRMGRMRLLCIAQSRCVGIFFFELFSVLLKYPKHGI